MADRIGRETVEFFLPRDFDEFCLGCYTCFNEGEAKCPHYDKLAPITEALDAADVIILASPVYVCHVTGAMKAFLDHYGYRWMPHTPEASMFKKQGVCICTAAGAGVKSALKDMEDSLSFWGVAKVYQYGLAVAANAWDGVSEEKRRKIDAATTKLANEIVRRHGKVKPGLKTRAIFLAMRKMQQNGYNPREVEYWTERGWTERERPWA